MNTSCTIIRCNTSLSLSCPFPISPQLIRNRLKAAVPKRKIVGASSSSGQSTPSRSQSRTAAQRVSLAEQKRNDGAIRARLRNQFAVFLSQCQFCPRSLLHGRVKGHALAHCTLLLHIGVLIMVSSPPAVITKVSKFSCRY